MRALSTAPCLLRILLPLLCPLSSRGADVDAYPPFWPLPRHFTNGSTTLSVPFPSPSASPLAGLAFSAHPDTADIRRAWTRALGVMFPWGAEAEARPRAGGEAATGPALTRVEVRFGDAASVPSLDMDESYSLRVFEAAEANNSWTCAVEAPTLFGAMHGLLTLAQMVEPVEGEGGGGGEERRAFVLKKAPWEVKDAPVFPHRGLMIDTSRHFLPLETVLRQVEALHLNKMNVLHWHATDAESMPVESEAFPGLGAKGAFAPSAVYSKADVAEVVEFARQRGVRVVVEFDMPGHNYAWSLSHPELFVNCSDMYPVDTRFWVASFDPTNEAVYSFLEKFLGEMSDAFPDGVIHLGGDEVQYSCWNESARIRSYMEEHHMNFTDLYAMFEQRVHGIARRHNKTVQSWDEVYVSARSVLPPDAIVQVWRGVETLTAALTDGFRGVLSAPYYLNGGFDMGGPQVMWQDIYSNDPMPKNLTKEQEGRMLGAEACIWGEEVNEFNIDGRTWFRASMLGERLWSLEGNYTGRIDDGVLIRSIKQECRMLRAGIKATPIDDRDRFPRRNLWAQCEVELPRHSFRSEPQP